MDSRLVSIADRFPTPLFVYFMDEVEKRIDTLRESFEGLFGISYAMKCNPNSAILQWMRSRVDTLDVSSGGELIRGVNAGWDPTSISFTGPAKRQIDLQLSIEHGIGEVVLESVNEARALNQIAQVAGRKQQVLIRVAPERVPKGFGVNMAGKPCQFGIDEEVLDSAVDLIRKMDNLDIVGFHIYSGTQCLVPAAIFENYEIFLDIFERACETHDIVPSKLVFGSGLGIPYHDGNESIRVEEIADAILPRLYRIKGSPRFENTTLLLETGRYLIGEAGYYLTQVVNRKESRGSHICICDGGMNHHLGACGHLGMVLHRPYRISKVRSEHSSAPVEKFDLFGPLCTSIDHLGRNVEFDGLDVGDVIAVACSGAYGATASPVNFISHDHPTEIMVQLENGQEVERDITHREPLTGKEV